MKRLLIALIILLSVQVAQALTRAELHRHIRYAVKDTTETTNDPRWSDSILVERINEVAEDIAGATLCMYETALIDPVTGQAEYFVSTDCIKVDRITYMEVQVTTGAWKRRDYYIEGQMYRDFETFEYYADSLPRKVFEHGNYFILSPAPSAEYCRPESIRVHFFQRPDPMLTMSAEPWNGYYQLKHYHTLIIMGVTLWCYMDSENWESYKNLYPIYQNELKIMAEQVHYRPDANNSQLRFGIPE